LKSATLRWWQAIDRGAAHVGEIEHFLSELDWDQDLIWFWHNKTRPWSGNGSVKSTSPAIICRENSAPLRVQGCDAFPQRSSLLGALSLVSLHVPPEVQEDGGAGPEFSGRAP
jgi:hypothetical protein